MILILMKWSGVLRFQTPTLPNARKLEAAYHSSLSPNSHRFVCSNHNKTHNKQLYPYMDTVQCPIVIVVPHSEIISLSPRQATTPLGKSKQIDLNKLSGCLSSKSLLAKISGCALISRGVRCQANRGGICAPLSRTSRRPRMES